MSSASSHSSLSEPLVSFIILSSYVHCFHSSIILLRLTSPFSFSLFPYFFFITFLFSTFMSLTSHFTLHLCLCLNLFKDVFLTLFPSTFVPPFLSCICYVSYLLRFNLISYFMIFIPLSSFPALPLSHTLTISFKPHSLFPSFLASPAPIWCSFIFVLHFALVSSSSRSPNEEYSSVSPRTAISYY